MKKIIFGVIGIILLGVYFGIPPYYTSQGIEDSYFETKYENANPNDNGIEIFKELTSYTEAQEKTLDYFRSLYPNNDSDLLDFENYLNKEIKDLDQREYNENYMIMHQINKKFINLADRLLEKEYIRYNDYDIHTYGELNNLIRALHIYYVIEIGKGNTNIVFNDFIKGYNSILLIANNGDYEFIGNILSITLLFYEHSFIENYLIDKLNNEQKGILYEYVNKEELVDLENGYKYQCKLFMNDIDKLPKPILSYFVFSKQESKNIIKRHFYNTINGNFEREDIKVNGYNYIGRKHLGSSLPELDGYKEDALHSFDGKERILKKLETLDDEKDVNSILLNRFKK